MLVVIQLIQVLLTLREVVEENLLLADKLLEAQLDQAELVNNG